MSFSDNLREARKRKGLSQEQLASIVDVSRQSVSKWEADVALPEAEKLVILAETLEVTIDYLMTGRQGEAAGTGRNPVDKILIKSYDGNVVLSCIKVVSSPIFYPSKKEPKFILNGVDRTGILGDHNVILGFYSDEESIQKEIAEIYESMENGCSSYDLKYYAEVIMKGLSPRLKTPLA